MISTDIRIVLVEPSHPGNVGAVARAMKNMALDQLVLVKPKLFPHATRLPARPALTMCSPTRESWTPSGGAGRLWIRSRHNVARP